MLGELQFNPSVRDGKPEKCIACGNPLHHKSEHYCSKKCATKMESESIGDVPAFLSKWKLRKYKEFKDPLYMLRKKTRRKTYDLLKKDIIQKQPCVVCGIHDVIAHHKDYSRHNDVIWICESIIQGIMMAKWAFSITNYGGIPSGSYPEVCVMGRCQGNIKNLNRNLKRNERLRRGKGLFKI